MTDHITAHQYAQQLCQASEPVAAVVAPQTYEPHCLLSWQTSCELMDETIDYKPKETQ